MSRASPLGRGGGGRHAPTHTPTLATTDTTLSTLRGMLRMIRPSRLHPILGAVTVLAMAFLAACNDTGVAPTPKTTAHTGRLLVYATAPAQSGISTLVIEVSGPGIVKSDGTTPDTLAFNIAMNNGVASGTIEIPAGLSRVITVHAFNGITETHRGTVTTDIAEGVNPTVSVTLVPLVGDVPITVTFGTTIVIVRPGVATVAVGDTLRLTAEIRDQDGNLVSGKVRWATLNPVKATVDTAGLVTVRDTGDVQVVATYGTVGGAAKLTGAGVASQIVYQLTWNGSKSRSWFDSSNWSPAGLGAARVPTLSDSVVVPANVANQPQLDLCQSATVRDLVIASGASLTVSCGGNLTVYGTISVQGSITPDVILRPGARAGGTFGRLFVYGDTAKLVDSVQASYVEVNGAPAGLILNGHRLTVGTYAAPGQGLYVANTGYLTMADGDTLVVYGNVNWAGGAENGKLDGGVTIYRGTSFYGYRYKGTGTNRFVLDRSQPGSQVLNGFDYVSDSTRAGLAHVDVKSADGARICGHVQINDTLTVTSVGTPSSIDNVGCGGYYVRALGPIITGPNTTVSSYLWEIWHPTGTSLVAGAWQPTYTDFDLAGATVNPALAYQNLRFYAPDKLTGATNAAGFLWIDGSGVDLDLNGHSLGVAGYMQVQNGGTITMQNAADSLEVTGYANFASNFSANEDAKLAAGVMRVGSYFYGYGFSASGTHRVVLTGIGGGNLYVQGLSFSSRPAQGFQNLEIAPGATYGGYNDARVKGTFTVRTGATYNSWSGSGDALKVEGDLVTEAGSAVKNYQMLLYNPTGTSKVAGTWQPSYTDYDVPSIPVKAGLAYQNLRFYAANKLTGATNAAGFLWVDGASVDLDLNGNSLGVAGYLQVQNGGTITMLKAADSLDVTGYANFASNFSSNEDTRIAAGVIRVGGYFYGYGFSASGTNRVVLTGLGGPTNLYVQGLSYSSRPYQGFQDLEVAANQIYGFYNDSRVKGVMRVRAGATVQDWTTNSGTIRVDGDLVTEVGSTVKNYVMALYNTSGTQNVAGAFTPANTAVYTTPLAGQLKPGLGYTNVQFYTSVTLPDSLTVNGTLTIDGAATNLTLNGKRLHVAGTLDFNNNAVLTMQNAADSLIVDGPVYWDGGASEAGKITDGVFVMNGPSFCATNFVGQGKHRTVFQAPTGTVRIDCVGGGAPPAQRFNNVDVKNGGITLNCYLWADGNVHVYSPAVINQNCNGQTLSVGDTLFTDPGSAITNGAGYPGNNALSVQLYDQSGTKYVTGSFDPNATYFLPAQAYVNPALNYRYGQIAGSDTLRGNTAFSAQLDIVNAAVVNLGGHKLFVGTTLNFDNTARLQMQSPADTMVVGQLDPTSTTYWDGANEAPGDLTNGVIQFYGARFYAPGYKPTAGTPHKFVFAANSGSPVSVEANPQFAQVEIAGSRTVTVNGNTQVNDTLRITAPATLTGTNYTYVKGGLVSVVGSTITGTYVVLDNNSGTRDVAGTFTPTNVFFRSGTPVTNAINPLLGRGAAPQYNNVYVEGPYQLVDSLRVAGSFNVTGDTNATLASLTLNGHRLATGPTAAFEVYNQASLIMTNPADSIIAGDSWRLQSNSGAGTSITDGVVVIGIGGGSFMAIDRDNVGFQGNSKLVLNSQGTTGYFDIWTSTNGLRPLPNTTVTGTRPIRLQTGSTVSGALNVTQPIAITGNYLDVSGPFTLPAGASMAVSGWLKLRDATGTSQISGAYNVATTYFWASSTPQVNTQLGYTNVDLIHGGSLVGGKPLTASGWLRVGYGGDAGVANDSKASLTLPANSSAGSAETFGTLQFAGIFNSAGNLNVRANGGLARALSTTTNDWVSFRSIYIDGPNGTGGVLDNSVATGPTGGQVPTGFRYNGSAGGVYSQGNTTAGLVGNFAPVSY